MSDNTNNPTAFPQTCIVGINGMLHDAGSTGGMTLRDYFAAKAMQAMVSSYRRCDRGDHDGSGVDVHSPERGLLIDENKVTGELDGANEVAADAYAIADAMLAARKAEGGAQ